MSKDRFGNRLEVGDFVVYAVGQGRSAGGQRFGRVTSIENPVFTSIEVMSHLEWDNPNETAYDSHGKKDAEGYYLDKPKDIQRYWSDRVDRKRHRVVDGYTEQRGRRIGGFDQVVKIIDIENTLKNQPMLLEAVRSMNE